MDVNNEGFFEPVEQEPVAYLSNKRQRINIELKPQTFVEIPTVTDWEMPLYMKPQQRTWVGLTDEEIKQGESKGELGHGFIQGALWAEVKLREKNEN
jgi:hypothetical protein